MAIDPALLAALTSGASSGSKVSSSSGIDWGAAKQNKQGAWSLGQSVIDILSTGGYATAGITRKVGENVAAIQRGELGGLLDLVNPLSVIPAAGRGVAERRTYSQNLRDLGVEDKTATWLGLALDIGLDPTTYITGGTIAGAKGIGAGVRLAGAANKANAKVAESAAEAAANNLPDLTRPFIPMDEPLTQGQKLGNYLTGVLRGYEFNKSAYAAERATRKLAKVIQKDAKKTKDNDFADEALSSLESFRKSENASIADDVAVLRREEFMRAVAQSPALQAKFGARAAKAAAKTEKAENLRFFDAKTAAKASEKQAAAAAKQAQMEKALELDQVPAAAVDEATALQKPEIQELVENEAVIANRAEAEKISAKISKAQKVYQANLTAAETKYGAIAQEALDFISRTTDPETGKRWAEVIGNVDNPLEIVADLLATGKIKPTANRTARFARAIGVSSDPQQSIVDLTVKTLLNAQKAINKLNAKDDEIQELGLELSRMLDSAAINATSPNGAAAAGMADAANAGAKVEDAMDLEQEIPNRVNDVINEEFFDTASTGAKTADEMLEAEQTLRALPQEQIAQDMAYIKGGKFSSPEFNMVNIARDFMESGPYDQIVRLAARLEKSVDEVLDDFADGDVNVINDPAFKLSRDAVRIDLINPEGRISTYNKLTNAVRANQGKSGRTGADSVEEEGRLLRNFENFWRLMGVPVKTRENILMQLRRDGQKMVGDKLSANFKPMDIDFTTADLDIMSIEKGAGEIMAALRYPGKTYQNVLPTNFEYAILTMARYKELGQEITPGSEAWLEIRKTFDEVYSFPEGTLPKKVPVDNFFKEAPHLNPTTIINGKKLKKIPNLDQKTEAVIKFMVDNADEILDISTTRAAARYARAVNETLPTATDIISDMVRFVSIRENFAANVVRLAQVPPVPGGRFPLETGAKGIAGLDQVKFNLKSLIVNAAKNAKVFTDPELAKEVSDMMLNMFMKSIVGGTAKGPLDQVDPIIRKRITDFIIQHMSRLRQEIATEIDLFDAIGGAKPKVKVTPKTAAKGKEARRKQVQTKAVESASLVPAAVKATDDVVEAMSNAAETAPRIGDEASNIPTNLAAGNADPVMAGLENVASAQIKALTDLNFSQNWLLKFSGRYGMGLATKVVIGGVEYFNQSKVGFFNNGLKQLFLKHNKDLPAINNAFKLVQAYGRDMVKRIDSDQAEIPFAEWAQTAKTDGVNMEIAEEFSDAVAAMFGADGVLTGSIQHAFFGDELNRMFDMRGFFDLGEGAFRLPDEAGPMAIKYSWAAADIDEKFTALTFLSNYASAMHAVQTRIGIGESFSSFFGKTLAQIKEEGLDVTNYVKIDPEDEFARYLNPDKLYDASELERLRFVKEYVLYPKSFSSKSMQTIVDMSDRITSVLKAAHTTWRPGHHVTSIVGEAFMNAFAGVNSPKYYENSLSILRAFDPSIYKSDPNVFKSYAEVGAPRGMQVKGTEFDQVGYINSTTGKRTIVSNEAIAYAAERLGILTRGGASTVEDLDLRGMADFNSNITGGVSRINSKLANFSSHRDNLFRMAHFVKELEKGGVFKSFEEAAIHAAKEVTTYHPTIGGLSAFERKVMRRAVFFYTWQRIAATKVAQLVLEQPGKVTIPSKIQYAFAEANGFNPESFGDPWDPDGTYASWHTGSTFGPQFQGPAGKGDAWGFGPAVPQLDIMNSLFGGYTVQPGESGLDVLTRGTQNLAGQNLSPLPKWFAELTTGNRVGTGGNINNYLEYAIDQVGGLNTLSKITGIGQDPETGLTPSEQGERKTRLLANWFLGQKLQDYSTSQTIKQWKNDQREQMKRLTGQD
jgi:hypothetical protein